MADEIRLFSRTNLSTDEIFKVLFNYIDVEIDQDIPHKIWVNDLSCLVLHNVPDAVKSEFMGEAENLIVDFSFRGSMEGYANSMRVALNWWNGTDDDTILAHNFEYILFSRIDGRLIRNIHPIAEIPGEILDLIDIPYEDDDLGFE